MKNLIHRGVSFKGLSTTLIFNKKSNSLYLEDEKRAHLKMVLYVVTLLLILPIITALLLLFFEIT